MANELLANWNASEAVAEAMIPVVGRLDRDHGVTVVIYGRSLVNKSPINILRTHRFARRLDGSELSVFDTFPLLEAIARLTLKSARIDLGMLAAIVREHHGGEPIDDLVAGCLSEVVGKDSPADHEARDVVMYGFGRIGRLIARLLIEKAGAGGGLSLRAVVVRRGSDNDLIKRASMLRRDSVHGQFNGTIQVDASSGVLIANGNVVRFIYSDSPEGIDYTQYGIENAVLIDSTGIWRTREELSRHLRPGVSRVVLTAPGKGDIPNVVYGVNHHALAQSERIISCASCTTNAIVPPLKSIEDTYGVVSGHVETVHSFTNDQNLLDNHHKADRRGRAAPFNLVLTETGAASAIAKALPDLRARITGNSIRVPTPNVSIAILNLRLRKRVSRGELLDHLRQASLIGPLSRCLDYTAATDAVSSDFIGSRSAAVVDANATVVHDDTAILYVWYDNEFGYSCQVMRTVQFLAGVEQATYPAAPPVAPPL